jgi:basic membrane lipoprotein Med (substrate-binding protein (PBP1-ABC) superfamily)
MFKTRLSACLSLLAAAALLLSACTAPATPTPAASGGSDKIQVFGAYATPLEEPWDNVIHRALQEAQTKGEIEYTWTDNIGYSGDMERVLREEASQKNPDIIIGDAFGNRDAVAKVASEFPEIAFVFGSDGGPQNPNLAVFDNWIHEPAYLCGLIAGNLTKTDTLGVVAAMPIPEVNRLVNAFIQGVKEVNPDAKVLVSFINSFFDPAKAKEAALAQIDAGADILYAERAGVIEAAAENGLLAFGNLEDQNQISPDHVLTSPVWNMGPTVDYVVKQVKAGAFTAQDLKDFSTMVKGGADLAPYYGNESKIPQAVRDLVKQKRDAIISGQFRVDINEAAPPSGQ